MLKQGATWLSHGVTEQQPRRQLSNTNKASIEGQQEGHEHVFTHARAPKANMAMGATQTPMPHGIDVLT
jgi:hypothetical protein